MRPPYRAATVNFFVLFSTLLAALLSGGCLSVPRTGPAFSYFRSRQKALPTIVGDHKPLTSVEVRAVIKGLEQNSSAADNLGHQMALEEAISGRPFVAGNRATLLINRPAAYAAMFKAIQNAKKSINVEIYILSADRPGHSFADLLMKKAAEGVHVNLIYDGIGSMCTPPAFFQRLTTAGVKVLPFNPITPLSLLPLPWRWSPIHRDHSKLVIVDGSIAFTGSANISDVCGEPGGLLSDLLGKKLPWRDTDVEIEGPVVAQFQKFFFATWKREKGPPIDEKSYFQPVKPQGNDLVMAVGSTWGEKNRGNYFTYLAAIRSAKHSIDLSCSYFIPDKQIMEALTAAARRGVDVKIILPHKSDIKLAQYGGRNYYSRLLKSGVKVYERRDVILHAKTAVIDGVWSTVGSDNMDMWSILRNNELNAVILSRGFAKKMETMFQNDLKNSNEITLQSWEHRSAVERLIELLTRPLVYWL